MCGRISLSTNVYRRRQKHNCVDIIHWYMSSVVGTSKFEKKGLKGHAYVIQVSLISTNYLFNSLAYSAID